MSQKSGTVDLFDFAQFKHLFFSLYSIYHLLFFKITQRTSNIFMHCHFGALPLLCHWRVDPQITDLSILLGIFSSQQVISLPILFKECLSIIMAQRLSNLVPNLFSFLYEQFIVDCNFCNLQFDWLFCL